MLITKKEESRELCTEAGWYAYDYTLSQEMGREDILKFRQIEGDFIYLSTLKQPFYKLENKFYMIKGVEGKNTFRLSMYRSYEEKICREVESLFEGEQNR